MTRDFSDLVRSPGLVFVWSARFFGQLGTFSLYSTYALLIERSFDWHEKQLGMVLTAAGLIGAAGQGLIYPRVSRVFGRYRVGGVGMFLAACFFFSLPLACLTPGLSSPGLHLPLMLLFILGNALQEPSLTDMVGFHAPKEKMGLAQGTSNSAKSLAAVVAPLMAGSVFDASPKLIYYCASLAALAGAGCVALARWSRPDRGDPLAGPGAESLDEDLLVPRNTG